MNNHGGRLYFQSSQTGTASNDGFFIEGTNAGGVNGAVNFWNYENGFMRFATNNQERMRIDANGCIGIGTTNLGSDPDLKLTVAGNVKSRELTLNVNAGADFVFDQNYPLMPLHQLEQSIKQNKHLPEIASAKEMQENGIEVSEMQIKLLQKVEELTLYVIDLKKENNRLKERMSSLEKQSN